MADANSTATPGPTGTTVAPHPETGEPIDLTRYQVCVPAIRQADGTVTGLGDEAVPSLAAAPLAATPLATPRATPRATSIEEPTPAAEEGL